MKMPFWPALPVIACAGWLLSVSAAEPDVVWRNFTAQQEFLRRNLTRKPEYRAAVDALRRARRGAADSVLEACCKHPGVRSAWARLLLARRRLSERVEDPDLNRDVIAASRKLRELLRATPEVVRAEKAVAAAVAGVAAIIRNAGGTGVFPPGDGLFDGLFDAIGETPAGEEERRIGFFDWLERAVLEEAPETEQESLRRLLIHRHAPLEAVNGMAPDGEEPLAEPMEELFRILASTDTTRIPPGVAEGMIEELSLEFGPVSRTLVAEVVAALPAKRWRRPDTEGFRWNLMHLYREGVLAEADGPWFLLWLEEGLSARDFAALAAVPGINRDAWLAAMIDGRVAFDRAVAAASTPVSGSGAVRERGLEARRKKSVAAAKEARQAWIRALSLAPERPEPLLGLVRSDRFSDGSAAERVAVFRELIRRSPGEFAAYRQMAESLLAVGGGNPLPVAELACAAMDSGRIDTGIPLFGFELLVLPGLMRWDYRWKKSFLLPGVARSGDRLFDWFEAAELPTDARNLLLLNRMSFEMATLRYDRALATRKRIPLDDAKLASLVEFPRWELPAPGWLPGFAEFQDPVPLLKLFTGKSGPSLQALEREFLRGKRDVPEKVAALVRAGQWTAEERDVLVDLCGRWTLPRGVRAYIGRYGNRDSFRLALSCGRVDLMIEMIRMGYRYDRFSAWPGESAWRIARFGRDPAPLNALKQAGDPLTRAEPNSGRTPLHEAASRPGSAMTGRLIALGVPCNVPDRRGMTPLFCAASAGNAEAVVLLLKAGADCNRAARGGMTPLMASIRHRRGSAVWEPLLRRSTRINARDRSGWAALHYAAEYSEDPELFKALLARGASRELRDRRDRTPAEIAAEHGRDKIAALLQP